MIDNSPCLLGKSVGLHTTVDEVDGLSCAYETSVELVLEDDFLDCAETFGGIRRPFNGIAQLLGYILAMSS